MFTKVTSAKFSPVATEAKLRIIDQLWDLNIMDIQMMIQKELWRLRDQLAVLQISTDCLDVTFKQNSQPIVHSSSAVIISVPVRLNGLSLGRVSVCFNIVAHSFFDDLFINRNEPDKTNLTVYLRDFAKIVDSEGFLLIENYSSIRLGAKRRASPVRLTAYLHFLQELEGRFGREKAHIIAMRLNDLFDAVKKVQRSRVHTVAEVLIAQGASGVSQVFKQSTILFGSSVRFLKNIIYYLSLPQTAYKISPELIGIDRADYTDIALLKVFLAQQISAYLKIELVDTLFSGAMHKRLYESESGCDEKGVCSIKLSDLGARIATLTAYIHTCGNLFGGFEHSEVKASTKRFLQFMTTRPEYAMLPNETREIVENVIIPATQYDRSIIEENPKGHLEMNTLEGEVSRADGLNILAYMMAMIDRVASEVQQCSHLAKKLDWLMLLEKINKDLEKHLHIYKQSNTLHYLNQMYDALLAHIFSSYGFNHEDLERVKIASDLVKVKNERIGYLQQLELIEEIDTMKDGPMRKQSLIALQVRGGLDMGLNSQTNLKEYAAQIRTRMISRDASITGSMIARCMSFCNAAFSPREKLERARFLLLKIETDYRKNSNHLAEQDLKLLEALKQKISDYFHAIQDSTETD